jgi:hypothetical protein
MCFIIWQCSHDKWFVFDMFFVLAFVTSVCVQTGAIYLLINEAKSGAENQIACIHKHKRLLCSLYECMNNRDYWKDSTVIKECIDLLYSNETSDIKLSSYEKKFI